MRDVRRLSAAYFTSVRFKLDLLSVLPTDLYFFFGGLHCVPGLVYPCSVVVRMNRLLRFYRISDCFDRTETRTSFPYVFRIGKLIFYILILIHWNACIYFAISYVIGFDSDRWVYNRRTAIGGGGSGGNGGGGHGGGGGNSFYGNGSGGNLLSMSNDTTLGDTLRHQYIYCFYWSTLTLTTIGEVPIPETDFEYTFVVINFLIGMCFYLQIANLLKILNFT